MEHVDCFGLGLKANVAICVVFLECLLIAGMHMTLHLPVRVVRA